MATIAETLNRNTDWKKYRTVPGVVTDVEKAISQLLNADSAETAGVAYWQLENRIVVQNDVYSVCLPAVRIFMASFLDPRPSFVRISILDLLYRILVGGDVENEGSDLIDQCLNQVKEGLWLIVKEFVNGDVSSEAARDILELVNTDIDYEMLAAKSC